LHLAQQPAQPLPHPCPTPSHGIQQLKGGRQRAGSASGDVRALSARHLCRAVPQQLKRCQPTQTSSPPRPLPSSLGSSPPPGPRCHPTVCLTQMRYEIASSHRLAVVVHATVHPPHLLPRRSYCSLTRATRTKLREIGADVFVSARQKIVTRCLAPPFHRCTRISGNDSEPVKDEVHCDGE